ERCSAGKYEAARPARQLISKFLAECDVAPFIELLGVPERVDEVSERLAAASTAELRQPIGGERPSSRGFDRNMQSGKSRLPGSVATGNEDSVRVLHLRQEKLVAQSQSCDWRVIRERGRGQRRRLRADQHRVLGKR